MMTEEATSRWFATALTALALMIGGYGCEKRLDRLFGIPTTGELLVTTVTTGANLDPDGYEIRISRAGLDDRIENIGVNDLLVITLSTGNSTVRLEDVATNCTVDSNPQLINTLENVRQSVTFRVACT